MGKIGQFLTVRLFAQLGRAYGTFDNSAEVKIEFVDNAVDKNIYLIWLRRRNGL
jgi:hypothetical protein